MSVGLLLLIFLVQIFNATVKAWKNDTYREARAAMQMMARDLSQTIAPLPVNPFASPTPTPSVPQTSVPGTAPVLVLDRYPAPEPPRDDDDKINEEAYWLTTISNTGASELCAVGYFCVWMPDLAPAGDKHAPHAFALMRQFLGSGRPADPSKGTAGGAIPGLFDRIKSASGKQVLSFLDLYERTAPPLLPRPATSPPTSAATELCSYVWDLQFRVTSNLQRPVGNVVSPYTTKPPYSSSLPPFVEIRFKALSAAAARQLEGNTTITKKTWVAPSSSNSQSLSANEQIYQRIIQPSTQQFVVRVPIQSGVSSP